MQEEHDTKLIESCETICDQCLQKSLSIPHRCKICHKESEIHGAIIYESKKYKGKEHDRDNPRSLCFLLLMIPILLALMVYFGSKNCRC